MILGVSDAIESETHKETVMKLLMAGFRECAHQAGGFVGGGQSVRNASPLIGGVASAVLSENEIVRNDRVAAGDVLVLTKPLGTDMAVRRYVASNGRESVESYEIAVRSMAHLNAAAADAMRDCGATGATDVTGFGLLGHAANLASVQKSALAFRFFLLPVIAGTAQYESSGILQINSKLFSGKAVETSGGLLVAFRDALAAAKFVDVLRERGGTAAWVVGQVEERMDGMESAFLERRGSDDQFLEKYKNEAKLQYASCEGNTVWHTNSEDSNENQISQEASIGVLEVTVDDMFSESAQKTSPCVYDQTALAAKLL